MATLPVSLSDPRLDPIVALAEREGFSNVREVGTGGGINAVLFDRDGATYSVFLDADYRDTFAVLRHVQREDDDGFWSCESRCEAHVFGRTSDFATAVGSWRTRPHAPRSKSR